MYLVELTALELGSAGSVPAPKLVSNQLQAARSIQRAGWAFRSGGSVVEVSNRTVSTPMPNMHHTSLPPAAQPIAANASLSMAMVDSGTSLLALPPAMAQAFGEVVLTAAKQAHLPLNASVTDGICFQGVTINEAAVALPPLTFVFGNSVNVTGEQLTWLWHGCRCHAAAQAAWCATRTGAVESCRLPAVQCCVSQ